MAARLAWFGSQEIELFGQRLAELDDYTEVYRSARVRPNPFARALPAAPAEVPLIRIFEVR